MSRVNFAVGGRCAVECCLQTIICLRSTRPLGVPVHACAIFVSVSFEQLVFSFVASYLLSLSHPSAP